jgi:7-cyano-7-deazaguanine reductase
MPKREDHTRPPQEELTLLGRGERNFPRSPGEARLETFANTHPGRDYRISLDCPEFTSVCPVTGQPDFGHLLIEYIPDERCLESKSLKLYLFSYRNHGAFHEEVVNRILDDVVKACAPRQAMVTGDFNPRGGIAIRVRAAYPRDPDSE